MGAMENAHTVAADLVDFSGGPPSDARAAPPPDKARFQAIVDGALFDSKFWHRVRTPLRRPVCGKCGTVTPDSPPPPISVADRGHEAMADNNDNDAIHITLQAYWTIISSAAKICGGDQKGDKPRPRMMTAMRGDNTADNASHDVYVEWTREHADQ